MNKNKKQLLIPLILVLIIGTIVAYGLYLIMNSKVIGVLVPSKDIVMGESLSQDNTTIKYIAKKDLQNDDISEDAIQNFYGKTAASNLYAGEPILQERIADGLSKGLVQNLKNPDTDFVVQVPLDDNAAPQGLTAGDNVVLTATVGGQTSTVTGEISPNPFRVIQVSSDGKSLALEVTPQMYVKVQHALQVGKIRVGLVSQNHKNSQLPGENNDSFTSYIENAK